MAETDTTVPLVQTDKTDSMTQVPDNVSFNLRPDGMMYGAFDMKILMSKRVIKCHLCNKPIIENIYYCTEDNIFMHKECLRRRHRNNLNPSIIDMHNRNESQYHEDKAVNVAFVDENPKGNNELH